MTETATSHKPGDRMDDSTVYAGSLDGRDLYTTPADAPLTYTFNEAAEYANKLNRDKHLGHDDWRVPDKDELNVLFNNRTAIRGFNLSGKIPAGVYVSSSEIGTYAVSVQRFKNGFQANGDKSSAASLRCVRG